MAFLSTFDVGHTPNVNFALVAWTSHKEIILLLRLVISTQVCYCNSVHWRSVLVQSRHKGAYRPPWTILFSTTDGAKFSTMLISNSDWQDFVSIKWVKLVQLTRIWSALCHFELRSYSEIAWNVLGSGWPHLRWLKCSGLGHVRHYPQSHHDLCHLVRYGSHLQEVLRVYSKVCGWVSARSHWSKPSVTIGELLHDWCLLWFGLIIKLVPSWQLWFFLAGAY